MRLHEIELALKSILHINKDLNKERLQTLLEAAGWEEGDIRDAIIMWETESLAPVDEIDSDHLLSSSTVEMLPEIKVEKVLSEPTPKEELFPAREDAYIPEVTGQAEKKEEAPTILPAPSIPEKQPRTTKEEDLPRDLPLRPYDSSYVTVPLEDYEKRFAPHITPPEKPAPAATPVVHIAKASFEEARMGAPLEKEDKYIVVLAIIMFLVLMLLLGYMYSNGRI
jgi:hypothetical protein